MNRKVFGMLALAASVVVAATPARADVVTEWNEIADTVVVAAPPFKNRIMAMVQVAVHDALNSIDRRYETLTGVPAGNSHALPAAAVAAASYQVLLQTVPAQGAALAVIYNGRIAGLSCPAGQPNCIAQGIAAGDAAAFAVLALRANDGSATPNLPYTLLPGGIGASACEIALPRARNCAGICRLHDSDARLRRAWLARFAILRLVQRNRTPTC
jgi:hypothetical protein